jgi:formylglycine-generating enzyme required for sulfatase activity
MPQKFAAEFVAITPGHFIMGCQNGEGCSEIDAPSHPVRITKAFEIGKYEVTQEQWESVMGVNPSDFRGPDLPVEQVSWNDVQQFLIRLNDRHDGFHLPPPN